MAREAREMDWSPYIREFHRQAPATMRARAFVLGGVLELRLVADGQTLENDICAADILLEPDAEMAVRLRIMEMVPPENFDWADAFEIDLRHPVDLAKGSDELVVTAVERNAAGQIIKVRDSSGAVWPSAAIAPAVTLPALPTTPRPFAVGDVVEVAGVHGWPPTHGVVREADAERVRIYYPGYASLFSFTFRGQGVLTLIKAVDAPAAKPAEKPDNPCNAGRPAPRGMTATEAAMRMLDDRRDFQRRIQQIFALSSAQSSK